MVIFLRIAIKNSIISNSSINSTTKAGGNKNQIKKGYIGFKGKIAIAPN